MLLGTLGWRRRQFWRHEVDGRRAIKRVRELYQARLDRMQNRLNTDASNLSSIGLESLQKAAQANEDALTALGRLEDTVDQRMHSNQAVTEDSKAQAHSPEAHR